MYNREEQGRGVGRPNLCQSEGSIVKHIKTIQSACLKAAGAGCGECQSSCQSACKTSCTVANQTCQKKD